MRIAQDDLVPTDANRLDEQTRWAELVDAGGAWTDGGRTAR